MNFTSAIISPSVDHAKPVLSLSYFNSYIKDTMKDTFITIVNCVALLVIVVIAVVYLR